MTTDELRTWFLVELPVHRAFATQVTAQVSPEMTPQVVAILKAAETPCFRDDLQAAAGIKHRKHFHKQYLLPTLEAGRIEMTIPDKPHSSKQQYRLTLAGRAVLDTRDNESQASKPK